MKWKRLIRLVTASFLLFNLCGFKTCTSISNVEIIVSESVAGKTGSLKMLILDKKALKRIENLKANNTYKKFLLAKMQGKLDSLMNSSRSKFLQYKQLSRQKEKSDSLLELEYKKLIRIKHSFTGGTEKPGLFLHIYNTGNKLIELNSIRLTDQKNKHMDIPIGKFILPGKVFTTEITLPGSIQPTGLRITPGRINLLAYPDINQIEKKMDILLSQLTLIEARYAILKMVMPDILNRSYFKPSITLIESILSENFNITPQPVQTSTPKRLSVQTDSYIFIYSPERPDTYQWLFHITTDRQTVSLDPANRNFLVN